MDAPRLAAVGSALGSESRAAIVCALMSGTAHTGVELARHLGLSRSTVSEHLAVLVDAGLVAVEAQGRHRYHRLAGPDVAGHLEQLVASLPASDAPPRPTLPTDLAAARSCYDHVAGRLGVLLLDRMVARGLVAAPEAPPTLTDAGRAWFAELGITLPEGDTRARDRACLDWSERRPHLAGPAAAALLRHMLDDGWMRRHPVRRRVLVLTPLGRDHLAAHLDLEVP